VFGSYFLGALGVRLTVTNPRAKVPAFPDFLSTPVSSSPAAS
jgi:hypothetical protein